MRATGLTAGLVACIAVAVALAAVSGAPTGAAKPVDHTADVVNSASTSSQAPTTRPDARNQAQAAAASALHVFSTSGAAGCDLSGQWTGVGRDAFTVTHDTATGAVSVFSNFPDPFPGNPDGKPGWASAYGTVTGTMVALTLDYSLVSPTLTGKIDSSCGTVIWDDATSWTRMQPIAKVHMVGMNHLDVGYNGIPAVGFINNVLNRYFHVYFPRAIAIAKAMRSMGTGEGYIYTTHPWLVSMYVDCPPNLVLSGVKLQCPDQADLAAFSDAVARGDIVWHAGPYNLQPENCGDPDMFEYGLSIAAELDARFGRNRTITLSQRDVPGMTRSVIPLLVKHGVKALSVGVNPSTAPPAVPKAFVWKDAPSGTEVLAMWHPGGYPDNPGPNANDPQGLARAGCVTVPGLDEAMCWAFRTDNSGPPASVNEVRQYYATIRGQFPGADVVPSTFDAFTAVLDTVRETLPVVTGEVGDTWMMGVPSDPLKMSQYREIMRARRECLDSGACSPSDAAFRNFSRFLLKTPEHTWGIPSLGDNANWTNAQFEKARAGQNYVNAQDTWQEQRFFNELAIQALGDHPLAATIRQRLAALTPAVPSLSGMKSVDAATIFSCAAADTTFGFDPATGGVNSLKVAGTVWATAAYPIGWLSYHTYNATNFDVMDAQYDYHGNAGFAKPNVTEAHPKVEVFHGAVQGVYVSAETSGGDTCHVLLQLAFDPESWTTYGAPRTAWVDVRVQAAAVSSGPAATLQFNVQLFNKTATRLPESAMMNFAPPAANQGTWWMDKLGEPVSPMNVVLNGSQHQHGVWKSVTWHRPSQPPTHSGGKPMPSQPPSMDSPAFEVVTPDAPLVCPITTAVPATPFPVPLTPLKSTPTGFSVNLFNQIWFTNYPQYYPYLPHDGAQNIRYRFNVTVAK